jgi:hypothetical protein
VNSGPTPSDNEDCPRFIAFIGDDFIEGDQDLDALIAMIRDDDNGDDVVIWEDFRRVAAVVLADGKAFRFVGSEPMRVESAARFVRGKRR